MQLTVRRRPLVHRVVVWGAVVAAALVLHPSPAAAQWLGVAAAWSAPGATGVADESSAPFVSFDQAKASVRPTAPAGTIVWVRFPVFVSASWIYAIPMFPYNSYGYYTHAAFTLSFQRNEDSAIVLASLRRVRLSDGEVALMASLDSLSTPASGAVQTVTKNLTCDEACFRPDQYAYWVEAAMWKVKATSDPKIVGVSISLTP